MGIIEQQKDEIDRQFISLVDAVFIVAESENVTNKESILWLYHQDELIRKQLMLTKENDFLLIEFKPVNENTGEYYEYPADCLLDSMRLCIALGELEKITNVKNTGFARKRFLFSLANLGVNVKQSHFDYAISYIPKSYDDDDAHSVNTYNYLSEHLSELAQENSQLVNKVNAMERNTKNNNLLIEQQKTLCRCDDVLAENTLLKQRISELEQQLKQSQQTVNKPNIPNDIDLLAHILDTRQQHHAPDLALSIQLYRYVYIDKPRQDSHSSKANTWLTNNTGYDKDGQSGSSIREITAPLNGWNPQRDKNFSKR